MLFFRVDKKSQIPDIIDILYWLGYTDSWSKEEWVKSLKEQDFPLVFNTNDGTKLTFCKLERFKEKYPGAVYTDAEPAINAFKQIIQDERSKD